MKQNDKQFYSPQEVADLLGVNIHTIYKLLRKGDLAGIKIRPKLWRINKNDLEIFLKKNRRG